MSDAREWVSSLPAALAPQRALLLRLLEEAEADERWRFVELCCSLVRGNADDLSDVDVALGANSGEWAEVVEAASGLVTRLGPVVDVLQHELGWSGPHQRLFVQYDGVQLDLVVFPAASRKGLPPGAKALMDKDGTLGRAYNPPAAQADAATLREWSFLGWIALANVHKYLTRGSLWEAAAQLDQARDVVWRLWGARHDVEFPAYGLTSVLDAPEVGVPAGIEATVAHLDAAELTSATLRLAELLEATGAESGPAAMARHTLARLATLAQQHLPAE